ncbi:iron-siderophore ABC transporter substrate-binding protein [Cohnella terricola]|uniref:Iron-siderophore ABC transporter substrate-binding protein n=1 Tax=Cohnella terricola TaxID=1289167 RepID=A0A559JJ87_9BACL|nr:iron-siderophore ABC transporter substrate-binding protein [Cohnella terricola]TVX99934.1 iron-siderophore ABC transporter substrate-binding protein [Cohnella terricola]
MRDKQKVTVLLTLLIAFMLIIAGCGNASSNSSGSKTPEETKESATAEASEASPTSSDAEEAGVKYPIVIEHALGTTVIEKKPERIATIQWANHDIVLALGVEPVGFSAANFGVQDGSGMLPWTLQEVKKLGIEKPNIFQDTDGLDFEAISDAKPDVILAAYSGITKEDYDLLTKIAPVVAYPTAPWATTWREQVIYNATGMGMAPEGERLIKDTEGLIQDKLTQYPQINGKKVVWANFSGKDLSKLHIYTPIDSRVAFLHELGLSYPDAVTKQITDPKSYALELSAENAQALYEADVIVGYGNNELLKVLQADRLLGKIPAIKKGAVAFIDTDTPLVAAGTPNPLSIAYTIDEYLKLIGDALDRGNE